MPIGALLAGLLLAETEYRRQIEVTIEPFKGLLLGVFLISVGMSLDLREVLAEPLAVLGGIVGLVAVKFAIIAALVRLFGYSWRLGAQAGLLLGPGGEFGLVILTLARDGKLADPEILDWALVVIAITMITIPLLFNLARRWDPRQAVDSSLLAPSIADGPDPVLIAGFGRVGQTVATMLERHRIPYIALDLDPDRIASLRAQGRNVFYGDITRAEMLHHLDLTRARALVVTLDDRRAADALVTEARSQRPDLHIIARARDASHAAALYEAGATDAVAETVEASLQLSEAVLVDLGVPMGHVIVSIHEQRAAFQGDIRARAPLARVRSFGSRRVGGQGPGGHEAGAGKSGGREQET
jgi:CPA2 family monovalent cation:H+ antiporter-2